MLTQSLARILEAESVERIEGPFMDALASLGFTNVFYAARFMLALPSALANQQTVMITSLSDRVLSELHALRGNGTALWADWASRNDGEISSRELFQRSDLDQEARSYIHAIGLNASQLISLRDKVLRSAGAIILNPAAGATHDDVATLWLMHGADIRTLCWVTHMRISTMLPLSYRPVLTPRQREVLEWRSVGKTVGEIATILGVTPATVEKHMRLAREALGVQTTPQAVLKAHIAHELFRLDTLQDSYW